MMSIEDETENSYASVKADARKYVDRIVNSPAPKKVVAAGAGTGKTNLFKEVIADIAEKANDGNREVLILSFLNVLVEDLKKDFEEYPHVEVSTLHGYALSVFREKTKLKVDVFPGLLPIMQEELAILGYLEVSKPGKKIKFEDLFLQMNLTDDLLTSYRNRRDYYGDYYDFSDLIFELVEYLTKNKDDIPLYRQICIDEYQDFNKLEVSLIKLLGEKSRMLIVGDDDQALYSFKKADSTYIREIHNSDCKEYESFSLPYCYRCTRVIVSAVRDVVGKAKERGRLQSRISKEYIYCEREEKNKVSNENSKIIHARLSKNQIANFIKKQLEEMEPNECSNDVESKFSVLIIAPTNVMCKKIAADLKDIGFMNIEFKVKESKDLYNEGLDILLKDGECNLGWRIVSKGRLDLEGFEKAILKSYSEDPIKFKDCLDDDTIAKVKEDLENKRIAKEETICTFSPEPELSNDLESKKIIVSTFEKSKGRSADYVFIVQFGAESARYYKNDEDKDKDEDAKICKFIVALTRAKRKVFLLSEFSTEYPILLKWIKPHRIEEINQ